MEESKHVCWAIILAAYYLVKWQLIFVADSTTIEFSSISPISD